MTTSTKSTGTEQLLTEPVSTGGSVSQKLKMFASTPPNGVSNLHIGMLLGADQEVRSLGTIQI